MSRPSGDYRPGDAVNETTGLAATDGFDVTAYG